MKPVIITAATQRELSLLIAAVGVCTQLLPGGVPVYEGMIGGRAVVVAVTGVGKVNTAACTATLLGRYQPALLINTGCGGAYPGSGLSVGDVAVATVEVYGDEGVMTTDGWRSMELIGLPLCQYNGSSFFNEFPLSAAAAERAVHAAGLLKLTVREGRFLTVSCCSGTLSRGWELARRFDAVCENMEGAAAAHIALAFGVDCVEIRGISNLVEDRDLSRWDIDLAVENVQRAVLQLLDTYTV